MATTLSCLCSSQAYAGEAVTLGASLQLVLMLCLLLMTFAIGLLIYFNNKFYKEKVQSEKEYALLSETHDALLSQKHQWLEQEKYLLQHYESLENRLNARTETVNKVNFDLTKTLEHAQNSDYLLTSLHRAINDSALYVIIIDKHYRICFISQALLDFIGLNAVDVQNQPLRQLEKSICLPEMAPSELVLNSKGRFNTSLKCRDKQEKMHVLPASISLTWSTQKEILHYVLLIEPQLETERQSETADSLTLEEH